MIRMRRLGVELISSSFTVKVSWSWEKSSLGFKGRDDFLAIRSSIFRRCDNFVRRLFCQARASFGERKVYFKVRGLVGVSCDGVPA